MLLKEETNSEAMDHTRNAALLLIFITHVAPFASVIPSLFPFSCLKFVFDDRTEIKPDDIKNKEGTYIVLLHMISMKQRLDMQTRRIMMKQIEE